MTLRPVPGERGIDHGDLDMLALAAFLAFEQRRRHRLRHRQAGHLVDDNGGHQRRGALARDGLRIRHAGHCLHRHVIDALPAIRPVGTEARHARVDQPVVERACIFPAEAQPLGDAGAEILDEHVRPANELLDTPPARGILQVERFQRLRPVHPGIKRRIAVHIGAGQVQRIALGRLHLDHFGALFGQPHRAHRRRHDLPEIDDLHARQRSTHKALLCGPSQPHFARRRNR